MRTTFSTLTLAGLIALTGCQKKAAPTAAATPAEAAPATPAKSRPGDSKDFARLQGTWRVVAIEAGGNPVPADKVAGLQLDYVFNEDTVTVRRPDRPDTVSGFVLGKDGQQKTILIQQRPAVRAAYAFEGGKLKLCILHGGPRGGYPKQMTSTASPQTDLLTLEKR